MKVVLKAVLTLLTILAICWVLLRLALPHLSYERITWIGAIFFLVAGIVAILRSRSKRSDDGEARRKRKSQTIEGGFYLAVAVLIAVVSSLLFKQS